MTGEGVMKHGFAAALAASLLAAPGMAQQGEPLAGAYTIQDPVNLYDDGTGPAWADWPGNLGIEEETVLGGAAEAIFNVSVPTITAYLPPPERNTGTAVVIAPGGGFRLLAMGHEGWRVAEYLAERGVAAFVLKYRLVQLDGIQDFGPSGQRVPREQASAPGTADGLRAIELVRANAGAYGIEPARVGIVGFSAGAHIAAMNAMDPDAAARPDFAAPIYGAPFLDGALPPIPAPDAPDALPPFFIATAQDDATVGRAGLNFALALMDAGYLPEVHLYRDGAHGFGMTRQGTTSDLWADQFFFWMTNQGWTQKPGDPPHEFTPMPPPNLSGN